MFKPVTNLILDLDGAILDTEPLYTKAIQNVVGKYDKTFTWELKARMMGANRIEGAKFIVKELDLPITWEEYDTIVQEEYNNTSFDDTEIMPDTEGVYRKSIGKIAKRFGKTYTPDIIAKVTGTPQEESVRIAVTEMKLPISAEEFRKEYVDIAYTDFATNPIHFIPGAKKFVHHLFEHKIPMAVATSSSHNSFNIKTAKHKEFFKLFEHIVCGGSDPVVKRGKPNPDIFLVAASRFQNRPKPEKCLVIEDAPNGVQAGIRAGMQVVMIPDVHISMELRKEATLVTTAMDKIPLEKFGLPPIN